MNEVKNISGVEFFFFKVKKEKKKRKSFINGWKKIMHILAKKDSKNYCSTVLNLYLWKLHDRVQPLWLSSF